MQQRDHCLILRVVNKRNLSFDVISIILSTSNFSHKFRKKWRCFIFAFQQKAENFSFSDDVFFFFFHRFTYIKTPGTYIEPNKFKERDPFRTSNEEGNHWKVLFFFLL